MVLTLPPFLKEWEIQIRKKNSIVGAHNERTQKILEMMKFVKKPGLMFVQCAIILMHNLMIFA